VVTIAQFRQLALALQGATEAEHMGHPDFRANGRIFASLHPDAQRGMVVLTPPQQKEWLAAQAGLQPASGAWGRSGCTLIALAALDRAVAAELLTEAWQNAMAKKPGQQKPGKQQPRKQQPARASDRAPKRPGRGRGGRGPDDTG
jgi:hypothetical protein